MADPTIKDLAYRGLASVLGGPVDLATMVMRPFGYNVPEQQVVGGSEWIGKQLEDVGLVSSARAPVQEFIASMAIPTPSGLAKGSALGGAALVGAVKGGGKTGEALKKTDEVKMKSIKEAADEIWKAIDTAGDGYLAIRGDDAVIKTKFRNSWNRPDGEKTTRLPGLSVLGLGDSGIDYDDVVKQVTQARKYGKNIYLVEGEVPYKIQHLANDPGEALMTNNKIVTRIENVEKN